METADLVTFTEEILNGKLHFLRIWSHLLKKSLMENFIFLQCFMIRDIAEFYKTFTCQVWKPY